MNAKARVGGYLLVCLLLVGALIASPAVWATPAQTGLNQTIPTVTPKGSSPTDAPTSRPPTHTPAPPATDTPAPPPETVISPASGATFTVAPTATSAPLPVLTLTLEVNSAIVWAGTELSYTLTLTNQGPGPARAVDLTLRLSEGLDPGEIAPGSTAVWEGNTVRLLVASLPPGEQRVIAISAVVRSDLSPGAVLVSEASVMVGADLLATARVAVALPPAELPPTGACDQPGPSP